MHTRKQESQLAASFEKNDPGVYLPGNKIGKQIAR